MDRERGRGGEGGLTRAHGVACVLFSLLLLLFFILRVANAHARQRTVDQKCELVDFNLNKMKCTMDYDMLPLTMQCLLLQFCNIKYNYRNDQRR